ncbi:MAG: tRNA (N6-threonylcarbamoyladenosine(37)-N6)-methyltransferase TrmO [Bacteroidota bacterium]|nr:tRNA (N6-threonylcarbamoyladenosine(37)-N6)-methyltransferase TrmO [Bacteroidota bacterium]
MKDLTLSPIGYITTPFRSKAEAPHQPGPTGAEGTVQLLSGQNFEQALEDLEGIEKIWLIYWFDRNPNWKPKVLVPRGERKKRGVFATRSPHRPNPIGLSLVDLVRIKGLTLFVRNVDLLDETPILDIKPYLPAVEAYPYAKAGWIDAAESTTENPEYEIIVTERAEGQLTFLAELGIELSSRIRRVLSSDPTPHPYKRIEIEGDSFVQAIRGWRVVFRVTDQIVTIDEIRSGYSGDAFSLNEALSDDAAQRAFKDRYQEY